jgi:branched-chain amino acid transport system ATP-binding protein
VSLLELDDVDVGYGGVPAVRGMSLHVEPGEIVALLGPNGAGKTTTLLAISGLLAPLRGSLTVLGQEATDEAPNRRARRGLGHVPEDRSLFPDLTVGENIRLAVTRERRGGRQLFADAIEHFPALEPLRDRHAGLLSGGEQQMLALARAFVMRPRLLLIDEMSLGLAPVIVQRILPVLSRLAKETGVGVLLVEQHVGLALEIAQRAYVLSGGSIVLDGTSAEVRARPEVLSSSYLSGGKNG